ncbi:BspC domain-containing protein [Ciceribacter sp. RN22]|uniref:BspC domain-containing protein n=1 Tax=Ciceribacter sp. RN22 TaxID=2954932 RepID=UPI002092C491|nr:hypothetical protein [Ciceribacter sp. RN22]MCO6181061.1 hypothetical protein [Ciceribacter sp. RN22]MCO6181101.1 hypothetical protein [Ciceribacter sp. RN22]
MKSMRLLMITAIALASVSGPSRAEAPPRKSADYKGNYRTLVKDQHASPQIADCIATGHDLVKKSRAFDRLGFTDSDVKGTKVKRQTGTFSPADRSVVSTIVSVPGQARMRSGSVDWTDITLRCGFRKDSLRAIEIKPKAR